MTRAHASTSDSVRPVELGATAVEYSLILAAIAGVIVATVTTLGTQVIGLFSTIPAGF
jgi:Flp pilus assembly pilin Flp